MRRLVAQPISRNAAHIAAIAVEPQAKGRLALLGFDPIGSTTPYFAKYIDDKMAKYAKIIKDAAIKAE